VTVEPPDAADFYDAELRRHNVHFRAAADVGPGDHVLDIGCGAGQSTREAARAAVQGSALGVDLSAPLLDRARRLADAEGLHNVSFQHGDAEADPFPPARFDLCISRFGTMFFSDPVAAFTNIGRAMRPGARLVLLAWQDSDRNEWFTAVRQALAGSSPPTPTASAAGCACARRASGAETGDRSLPASLRGEHQEHLARRQSRRLEPHA
jgi:ubiquinone/menaquinone biosynthesis C-methylase UbiE